MLTGRVNLPVWGLALIGAVGLMAGGAAAGKLGQFDFRGRAVEQVLQRVAVEPRTEPLPGGDAGGPEFGAEVVVRRYRIGAEGWGAGWAEHEVVKEALMAAELASRSSEAMLRAFRALAESSRDAALRKFRRGLEVSRN